MFEAFFVDNNQFQIYGREHLLTILSSVVIGIGYIYIAKHWISEKRAKLITTILAVLVLLSQLAKPVIRVNLGNFDHTEDLPLHLCNMLPMVMPFVIYLKNRRIWAIIFLWIMAGTFQSLFTPTLGQSIPHYEYWRYWIVHCGLVMLAIYPIFMYQFRLKLSDLVWSAICLNILAFVMYWVNKALGSNYLYLMHKPEGDTIYNLLGPWPWYILSLELVMIVLFLILYLPFFLIAKKQSHGRYS